MASWAGSTATAASPPTPRTSSSASTPPAPTSASSPSPTAAKASPCRPSASATAAPPSAPSQGWRGRNVGTFTLAIQVGTPDGSRYEWFEALVDTGATYTTLPASALRALGVVPHDRAIFRLADNREV